MSLHYAEDKRLQLSTKLQKRRDQSSPVNHKGCLHKLLGSAYLAVWANEAQLLSVFKVCFTAILSPCRPAGTPLERPPPLRRCWQRPGAAALPAGESGNK